MPLRIVSLLQRGRFQRSLRRKTSSSHSFRRIDSYFSVKTTLNIFLHSGCSRNIMQGLSRKWGNEREEVSGRRDEGKMWWKGGGLAVEVDLSWGKEKDEPGGLYDQKGKFLSILEKILFIFINNNYLSSLYAQVQSKIAVATIQMTQNIKVIKNILPYLRNQFVNEAEWWLIELCQKEQGLRHLISLVHDKNVSVEDKMSAASILNRIIIQYGQLHNDDTIVDGLTFIFGDFTIPYKVKSMLVNSASFRLRKDPEQMHFIKVLLNIVNDILVQLNNLSNMQHEEIDESWSIMNSEADVANGCYTVIIIGHVIFSLVTDLKDQRNVTKYLKYIMEFVNYIGNLQFCIFLPEIIIKFPDIFIKLFKLYELLTLQGANEISQACFKAITEWPHLVNDLRQAYLTYDKLESYSRARYYNVSQGKLKLIGFHWDVLYYLNDTQQAQKVRMLLDEFVPIIKQTILKMNSCLGQGDDISYAANMLYILQFSYQMETEIDIKFMISDFQSLILPIIIHEIAEYQDLFFKRSPEKVYEKLCEVIEYPQQSQQILNPVTAITKLFINLSEDFYLHLFQSFRYSIESLLVCKSYDDWQPPQYLLNKQPIDLSAIFYIMSFMPYQNNFSKDIIKYLKNIITSQLVDRLDQIELAMFYFFLQNSWFQLYDEQPKEAKFLLNFAFKNKIQPSAKYFIYQFINTFSDYYIDHEFILEYSKRLPLLHQCKSKWKTMFNWLTFIKSFEEEFVLELVQIIQGHLQGDRLKSTEEVNYYGKMLKAICQKWEQVEDYDMFQNKMLSQYHSLKNKEKEEKNMSGANQEQLEDQNSEKQEENEDDEVCIKRKQSIFESFTKKVKRDQQWQSEQATQAQQKDFPLFKLSEHKVSDISAKVSRLSLE